MPLSDENERIFLSLIRGPNANGCLIWVGRRNASGYGMFGSKGAHRVAWERERGPIPAGMLLCHKCDVRECVNVDHHFLGSSRANNADKVAKGRAHAIRTCAECGSEFRPTHHAQQFCTTVHQAAFHNVWSKRGRVMGAFAAVMRMGKRGYNPERKYALREFCALMDKYNREDRAAGRRPEEYIGRKMRDGWSAVDLYSPIVMDVTFNPGSVEDAPERPAQPARRKARTDNVSAWWLL